MAPNWSSSGCSLVFGLAALLFVQVLWAAPQFSADTLQRGPDGKPLTGKLMVGDGRMRTEMVHQGQQIVRISDESRGVEWILFPERRITWRTGWAPRAGNPRHGRARRILAPECRI